MLATAGNLVFMGNGGGKTLSAYDAKTGTKLWSFDAKTAIFAAPISLSARRRAVHRRQRRWRRTGRLLRADQRPHAGVRAGRQGRAARAATLHSAAAEPAAVDGLGRGRSRTADAVYTQFCSVCHGANGFQARSSFPNLTVTPLLWTQEGFDQVVLLGGRADKGMGNFGKDLKPEDAAAVREYLISRANAIKAGGPGAGAGARGRPAPAPPETGHANQP